MENLHVFQTVPVVTGDRLQGSPESLENDVAEGFLTNPSPDQEQSRRTPGPYCRSVNRGCPHRGRHGLSIVSPIPSTPPRLKDPTWPRPRKVILALMVSTRSLQRRQRVDLLLLSPVQSILLRNTMTMISLSARPP